MNYSQLVKAFSSIAILFNFLEKALSYLGQSIILDKNSDYVILEGNNFARPVMSFLGVAGGHIVMLLTAVAGILLLRGMALRSRFILKKNPRQRKIVMAIFLFTLGYLSLDGFRVAYTNGYIIWKVLFGFRSFY